MKRSHLLVCLTILAGAGCKSERPAPGEAVSSLEAADLLIDRNWMDRWPRSDREQLYVYRFTPAMGGGVFQDRTLFAGRFELFNYETEGDRLTIRWPHTSDEDRIRYRIEKVDGPAPFDLRLTLDGASRGPSVFYGRSSESGGADGWQLP